MVAERQFTFQSSVQSAAYSLPASSMSLAIGGANEPPPRKRARSSLEYDGLPTDNNISTLDAAVMLNNDDIEQKLVESLLDEDGDDFVTEEQRQDLEAKRKRELRRLRLAQRAPQPETERMQESFVPNETAAMMVDDDTQVSKILMKKGDLEKPVGNGNKEDIYEDEHDDESDKDDFDMFSSSVSPVATDSATNPSSSTASHKQHEDSVHVVSRHNHHHEQADWDDSEGYYKATIGEVISLDLASSSGSATSIRFRVAG
jgi:hypothetical protein